MCEHLELLNKAQHKATKKHYRCEECWHWIYKGELYNYMAGIVAGEMFTHRSCLPCDAFRAAINMTDIELDDCGQAPLGGLYEAISESDAYEDPEFPFKSAPLWWLQDHCERIHESLFDNDDPLVWSIVYAGKIRSILLNRIEPIHID